MSITFSCACGKTLQVNDEFAGRRVRCPACQRATTVPAVEPMFEVVEDSAATPLFQTPPAKPAPMKANLVGTADSAPSKTRDNRNQYDDFEPVEDDPPRKKARRDEDDRDDEDDRPRKRRKDDRDDEDDRPRKKKTKPKKTEEKPTHFGLERRILNGGVGGGLLAMIIAVVWFVVGLAADRLFIYPPILFIIGLVAMIKGLAGGNEE